MSFNNGNSFVNKYRLYSHLLRAPFLKKSPNILTNLELSQQISVIADYVLLILYLFTEVEVY